MSPRLQRLDGRVSLEAGGGSLFGQKYAYSSVAPEVRYHINDRLSISGGIRLTNGFGLGTSYNIHGRERQTLAPRRGKAKMYEAYVSGECQVNERLWISATLLHVGGEIGFTPFNSKKNMTLNATGFFADLRYKTRSGSLLGFHLSYIHDNNGILTPYLYNPCMDGLYWYDNPMGYGFGRSFGFWN